MNCNVVVVAGYFCTGSGAVVDLLKEYKGAYEPGIEFRLIKDPYGLNDLRYNLVEQWDPLNSDNAIKDFIWLANHLAHSETKFSLVSGLGYSKKEIFGERFLEETNAYISRITNTVYNSEWWFRKFKQTKFERFKEKILNRFRYGTHTMYLSTCTEEEFDLYTKEYLENLFQLNKKENNSFVILDQGLAAQNPQNLNHFFDSGKMIIVDRDPRDCYSEMLEGVPLIGTQIEKTHDTSLFVNWYETYRRRTFKGNERILYLRFEDLILKYDETVQKIENFLGLTHDDHIYKNWYLKPEVSRNNIGKWEKMLSKKEIEGLNPLRNYFWDSNN